MVDIIIGIFILLFLYLGLRDGIIKSLFSIILVFIALFLATAAIGSYANPNNPGSVFFFIIIWAVIFVLVDFILNLLLRKIISITVLGPVDKVAGAALGVFKGVLIAGIILQVNFCFPIDASTKKLIAEARLTKISIAVYEWAYPFARKWSHYLGPVGKANFMEEVSRSQKIPASVTIEAESIRKDLQETTDKHSKDLKEHEEKLMKLLEDNKITPPAPPKTPQ